MVERGDGDRLMKEDRGRVLQRLAPGTGAGPGQGWPMERKHPVPILGLESTTVAVAECGTGI